MGILCGGFIAALIHRFTGYYLRLPGVIQPVMVLGWGILAILLFFISVTIARSGQIWAMAAIYMLFLLGLCGWLGVVHARRYQLPWAQTYGVILVEFGVAFAVASLFQPLPSNDGERWFIGGVYLSLLVTLLVLEFASPILFSYQPRLPSKKP